jgi:hypothetical protein
MTEVRDASLTLMEKARELDDLSKRLGETEHELTPLENELTEWVEAYHVQCWEGYVERDEKLPSEVTRVALAHRSFDREKYKRILVLRGLRNRRKRRISDIKEIVDAQRSIVSALKTEMEATEGPQPQWTGS